MTVIPGEVCGEVDAPLSKSYAQRVIAAQYLASSLSTFNFQLSTSAEDTAAAAEVASALASGAATVDVGESGLAARMFAPIAALGREPVTITGRGSLLKRPMTMMIEPLRALGVEVSATTPAAGGDFLPLTLTGPLRGGEAEVDGSASSQFLTGLLMAAPCAEGDTTIRVRNLRSIPYIDMTLEVMRAFGVAVERRGYEEFRVRGGQAYTAVDFPVEGDWSAAACLLVAGAFSGPVVVRGLSATSKQADVRILDALKTAGACIEQTAESVTVSRSPTFNFQLSLRVSPSRLGNSSKLDCPRLVVGSTFNFNATDCPDLFPALAALAAGCGGTSRIVGTERLTHKESDRAAALATEFGKLGIEVDISEPNVMRVTGGRVRGGVTLDSHADHRIAMALAVVALRADAPVVIEGAECVDKSYKNFWRDYEQLRKKF